MAGRDERSAPDDASPDAVDDEAVEPSADETDETDDSDETSVPAAGPAAGARTRSTVPFAVARGAVVVAVVTGLLAAAVLVWVFTSRSWEVGGVELAGDQEQVQQERDDVMGVGRQFVLRLGTYGPEGLEDGQLTDYRESVGEILSPAFRNSFEQSIPLVEQQVAQSEVSRDAEVFGTGVVEIEGARAAVLVAGLFTDSLEGEPVGEPIPLRLQVELVRVDGEWLVDNFSGVQAPEEEPPAIDPDLDIPEDEPSQGAGSGGGQGGGQSGGQGGGQGGQSGDGAGDQGGADR